MKEREPRIKELTKIAQNLRTAREKNDQYKRECEDFFYSDVEGTKTQFTQNQLKTIQQDYNIPLSINLCFPIVEQMVSFLVGNKPSARVVPVGESDKNTAYILQELMKGLWYKCRGDAKLMDAVKESLISGISWLFVEPTDFYHDNIFGVDINYLPYKYVYPDPNSKDWDYGDSEYIMISKTISYKKAKNIYNLQSDESAYEQYGISSGGNDFFNEIDSKPVTVTDLYEKKYLHKKGYITVSGKISDRKPIGDERYAEVEPGVYIYRTLFIESRQIIWEGWLPIKEYPMVPIVALHRPYSNNGNETYGIVHLIRNSQEAINKTLAHIILNAQTHSNIKMLIPEGMVDPQKVYDWAADPRRPLTFTPDPTFPNLKPERMQPYPLSNAHYTLFQELIKMVEYITGIYSVMQGNPVDAPNTFGTTQSLQVYGTQRLKLRAGRIDIAICKLFSSAINYIIFYSDRGRVFRYINDELTEKVQDPNTGQIVEQPIGQSAPWREVRLLDVPGIGDYDVVAVPNPSTPTSRTLASQLLGTIAGQVSDPNVAAMLTQYSLKLMDIPEADEILSKVDMLTQLQQQLAQMQQALQQASKQVEALQNENEQLRQQITDIDYKRKVEREATKAQERIKGAVKSTEDELGNLEENTELEEEETEPTPEQELASGLQPEAQEEANMILQ